MIAVIEVSLTDVGVTDEPPNFIAVAPVKSVPVIVTVVPPSVEPETGRMVPNVGTGVT